MALPVWWWAVPGIDVGRKGRASDGGRLLLPVRLDWDGAELVILRAGERIIRSFSAVGLGHRRYGEARIRVTEAGELAGTCTDADEVPREVLSSSTRDVSADLERLVEDGDTARWEILLSLDRHVERSVARAHAAVAAEVAGPGAEVRMVCAPGELEVIATEMAFGSDLSPSPLERIVDRIARPGTLVRVDPLRYIAASLRRDAEQLIRRRIGDPHVGPRIRAVAREHGLTDLEQICAVYNSTHSSDRIGVERARSAMAVARGKATVPLEHIGELARIEAHDADVVRAMDLRAEPPGPRRR
ncbi:hypothetical protein [Phytoactinopolyspora mesophila]|uniref:Uncharacterized protein n=1 Tax=Phytoactinopolyspora mesophila TaxID=2650750 RepID=A0A7K3MB25_9ACTN|nr:hypothetical protein [Phytoactinopolyspora mesophila]NDL60237.1 hypothetical protein [Phytoactinopolyspora mesophila]